MALLAAMQAAAGEKAERSELSSTRSALSGLA
jgi:hypothetical protein